MTEEVKDNLEIIKFDFSSTAEFNVDETYKAILQVEEHQKESKFIDANVKVKKAVDISIVNKNYFDDIEKDRENLFAFIRKYDPASDYIKSCTESTKTRLFGVAKFMLTEYGSKLNNLKFHIKLSYKEIHFLNNVLTRRLDYDGSDIFTYTELRTKYWNGVEEILKKLNKDDDALFDIDITTVTYLNHLIMKHKVKGSNEEYLLFRDILYKLNELTDIFNSFKVLYERINTNFTIWTTSITENNSIVSSTDNSV